MKNIIVLLLMSLMVCLSPGLFAQDEGPETVQADQLDQVFDFYVDNPEHPYLIAQAELPPADEVAPMQPAQISPAQEEESSTFWELLWAWLKSNWGEAILGLFAVIEVVVNLTPTERDNAWFKWLRDLVGKFLPNRKVGGGVHP